MFLLGELFRENAGPPLYMIREGWIRMRIILRGNEHLWYDMVRYIIYNSKRLVHRGYPR
jgi:hypothetical protein